MTTRLNRYCDGLIEAAWLAAVVILPLYFNVFSSRIFEPDKIALLRTLSLVILGAWVIKTLDRAAARDKARPVDPEQPGWKQKLGSFLRTPLVAPVLFLSIGYLVSTVLSVSPGASLWGSYQRLQGAYTTFSYLVIFAALAANLRKRAQVERLLTTIIIASLPLAIYGILQRYHLDPIPWGGDVSRRIASMLGNSIFIAAYLIMVFPLTLGRIVDSFRAILKENSYIWLHVTRATLYVFIGALQVIALYMSGSRGPALGWLAGSVFFIPLMLTVWWRKRWATFAWVGISFFLAVFLFVFNFENGPLEGLRSSPAIGRFGLLLNSESNSALVRRYIWEGAVKLVSPHDPLDFPDGSIDRLNFLRPLVGYGPESMFVAYSPFYTPALGIVERRNATPDRSHNETWDSMVNGGLLGLIAYLWLFCSVFYYGLKWMGLIDTQLKTRLFFGLYILGGVIGGLGFSAWRGVEYMGVGVPFGIFLGLISYILLAVLLASKDNQRGGVPSPSEKDTAQFITLLVLVAGIVSHFVEINFGISIAVTKTYFWVYTALLLLVGYILPRFAEYGSVSLSLPRVSGDPIRFDPGLPLAGLPLAGTSNAGLERANDEHPGSASLPNKPIETLRKNRRSEKGLVKGAQREKGRPERQSWREPLASAGLIAIILTTLGFDFVTNPEKSQSGLEILRRSFTSLPSGSSNGILMLILVSWLAAAVLFAAESYRSDWGKTIGSQPTLNRNIFTSFIVILSASMFLSAAYWLWHSAGLAGIASITPADYAELLGQVNRYAGVITKYYLFILGLVFFIAACFLVKPPARERLGSGVGWAATAALLVCVPLLIVYTNLRVVQADVTFKLADGFNQPGAYPVAIRIYDRANQLAPNEDYYYLYLGRAYLNQARSLTDLAEQDSLLSQAALDLKTAQAINPLNSDHTANLARLYSLWASLNQDDLDRQERAVAADEYFSRALVLSPNNVRLWNEWAYLKLKIQQQPEIASQYLDQALQIDPSYDWTYGQLGDVAIYQAALETDLAKKQTLLDQAAAYFREALVKSGDRVSKFNYALSLGGILAETTRFQEAAAAYRQALEFYPESATAWRVHELLAQVYNQLGDSQQTVDALNQALSLAPEDQKTRLQSLLQQLQTSP